MKQGDLCEHTSTSPFSRIMAYHHGTAMTIYRIADYIIQNSVIRKFNTHRSQILY